MNEKQLDALLKRKKSVAVNFARSEKDFTDAFFAAIARQKFYQTSFFRYAASLFILLGVTAAVYLPTLKKPYGNADKYHKISETLRLFGGDVAVLFYGNELITGERESAAAPENLVNIQLRAKTGQISLSLACSDDDSIYLDTADFSGRVVVSRCDASTLVVDMELNINGKTIRTAIPVSRRDGNKYEADALS